MSPIDPFNEYSATNKLLTREQRVLLYHGIQLLSEM